MPCCSAGEAASSLLSKAATAAGAAVGAVNDTAVGLAKAVTGKPHLLSRYLSHDHLLLFRPLGGVGPRWGSLRA